MPSLVLALLWENRAVFNYTPLTISFACGKEKVTM